ncbi:hypothetical protein AOLI_G00105360 [Acnodon oligacanthus]
MTQLLILSFASIALHPHLPACLTRAHRDGSTEPLLCTPAWIRGLHTDSKQAVRPRGYRPIRAEQFSFLQRAGLSSRPRRGEERQQHAALRSPCLQHWTENISGLIGSASETHAHDPAVTLSALTGHMLRRATCPVDNRLGKDYQGLAKNLAPLHTERAPFRRAELYPNDTLKHPAVQ